MTRPIAVDVTPEAEAAGYLGPRVALSAGSLAILDHELEPERLRRVGRFVVEVTAKAHDAREIRGVRAVVWAGRRLVVLAKGSLQGEHVTIIASAWEVAFSDDSINFDVMARETAKARWIQ